MAGRNDGGASPVDSTGEVGPADPTAEVGPVNPTGEADPPLEGNAAKGSRRAATGLSSALTTRASPAGPRCGTNRGTLGALGVGST